MNNRALVTVIMPCYRAYDTLTRSVEGVLSQTYEAWELVLIIDGADDKLESLANDLGKQDARIRIVKSLRNRGVSRSRNIGIRISKGTYLAFCDADDFWFSDKLEQQMKLMEDRNVQLVCSSFYFYNPITQNRKLVRTKSRINRTTLFYTNPIPLSTVLFSRSILNNCCFPTMPKPYIHEDYAFWILLFSVSEFDVWNLVLPTTEILQQVDSRSSNKFIAIKSHGYILRHYANIRGMFWLCCMMSYVWYAVSKRLSLFSK